MLIIYRLLLQLLMKPALLLQLFYLLKLSTYSSTKLLRTVSHQDVTCDFIGLVIGELVWLRGGRSSKSLVNSSSPEC